MSGLYALLCLGVGVGNAQTARIPGGIVTWGGRFEGEIAPPTHLNDIVEISGTLVLRSNGTVVSWGRRTNVPASLTNVVAIDEDGSALALKSDGTVVAWDTLSTNDITVPDFVTNVIAIAQGELHSLALKSNGVVVAWGYNRYGQAEVPPGLSGVKAIAAGSYHSLALKSDGTVVGWGDNRFGQSTPPPWLNGVAAIAAGFSHSLALRSNGTIVAWGSSYRTNVPAGLDDVMKITAGFGHSLAIRSNGTVIAWGDNAWGECDVPPRMRGAIAVSAGPNFSAALVVAPHVSKEPTSQTVEIGSEAKLDVRIIGSPPFYYRWFRGDTGAVTDFTTNSELIIKTVQTADAGDYTVVITNAFGATTSAPATLRVVPYTGIVTGPSEGDLRLQMSRGGSVTIDCSGTIHLSSTVVVSTNTILDGAGHDIAISGDDLVRVFQVNSNVDFTLRNITITGGRALLGAGILNVGGTVRLDHVVVQDNRAVLRLKPGSTGGTEIPTGGGILNSGGTICATNCVFADNLALIEGDDGREDPDLYVSAGAIGNQLGGLYLESCLFSGNEARSLRPSGCSGGAIHSSGTIWIDRCTFLTNSARSDYSQTCRQARGGAICSEGTIGVHTSLFAGNSASMGMGMWGVPGGIAAGGALFNGGSAIITANTFASNVVTGGTGGTGLDGESDGLIGYPGDQGETGGDGKGGALFNQGTASLVNNTFTLNQAAGGSGGFGGTGGYGGGAGGDGGTGGSASGAALHDASGFLYVTNCTFAYNESIPGPGGQGGRGGQDLTSPFVYGPSGLAGQDGSACCGGIATPGALLINTLLTGNSPSNGTPAILDAGHNLSSDFSCAFTNVGSHNSYVWSIEALADNDGPTWTMALLPGSPAIDAGNDSAAPSTDQRGVARPYGAASDIGAYESSAPILVTLPPTQTAEAGSSADFSVTTFGDPATAFFWLSDEMLVSSGPEPDLVLANLQLSQSGRYTLIASNAFGSVTSAPFALNVIAPVERRAVPGITLVCDGGVPAGVEYCDWLVPGAQWQPAATTVLNDTSQIHIDLAPIQSQRFYRGWQETTSGIAPLIDLEMVPAISLSGNVGDKLRLDYINAIGSTDAWVTLDTITLTNTSQLYFDTSSIDQPRRLYRIVPVP